MNLNIDIIVLIFHFLTFKQIFRLKFVSKLFFGENIDNICHTNYGNFAKHAQQIDELLNIFVNAEFNIYPQILDERLAYTSFDSELNDNATYDYFTKIKIYDKSISKFYRGIGNNYFLFTFVNDKLIKKKLYVPDDSTCVTLFEGSKYIAIIINSPIRCGIYIKSDDALVRHLVLPTEYICVDEKKEHIYYVSFHDNMCFCDLFSGTILDLDEKFISDGRSFRLNEIRYLISKSESDDVLIFRLMYFHHGWKIYEHKTRKFNHLYDIQGYKIYFSINLDCIYFVGHYAILYSIQSDKIIDIRERNCESYHIEFCDFNEYTFGITRIYDPDPKKNRIFKCLQIDQ